MTIFLTAIGATLVIGYSWLAVILLWLAYRQGRLRQHEQERADLERSVVSAAESVYANEAVRLIESGDMSADQLAAMFHEGQS